MRTARTVMSCGKAPLGRAVQGSHAWRPCSVPPVSLLHPHTCSSVFQRLSYAVGTCSGSNLGSCILISFLALTLSHA